jgi:APA family basic amino acid/polyamine antiporter
MSIWQEGVLCLVIVALCGFVAGISYRFSYAIAFIIVSFVIAIVASVALQFRQVSASSTNF